ncbi:hypothetical protein [uncultured Alistipes sp.]|uniref:hypothetical protein n=1 Tax=uncultured Alistipes sp. TaxID=538949 RepID=UPI0025865768|nr:hypothetical protein [uncultured Alistipes sp.]
MIRILKEVAFRFGYKCTSFPDPLFSENRIFPENTPFFRPFSEKRPRFSGTSPVFSPVFRKTAPIFRSYGKNRRFPKNAFSEDIQIINGLFFHTRTARRRLPGTAPAQRYSTMLLF